MSPYVDLSIYGKAKEDIKEVEYIISDETVDYILDYLDGYNETEKSFDFNYGVVSGRVLKKDDGYCKIDSIYLINKSSGERESLTKEEIFKLADSE